jgi:hypothetical protein
VRDPGLSARRSLTNEGDAVAIQTLPENESETKSEGEHAAATLARSGLFDPDWYAEQNPDVIAAGGDPLTHYLLHGATEGRAPNPWFDSAWYLAEYPDVAAAGANPLLHYSEHGEREGRRPMQYFDPVWYARAHDLPEASSPLRHFLEHRLSGEVAPCPELFAVAHLQPYRQLAQSGIDPFLQYMAEQDSHEPLRGPDYAIVDASGLFDTNYYLINGADIEANGLDPIDHFCRFGWREGRNPNLYFSTDWYRRTNPAVARMEINPLVHYVVTGERSGRRPVVYFDPVWYRETYAIPPKESALAHFLQHRRTQRFSPTPWFDVEFYLEHYRDLVGRNRDPFAHFLEAGTYADLAPSAAFDPASYRRHHLGRPSRHFRHLMHPAKHNPLIHYLHSQYR